jgi:hypothetical protein
VSTVSDSQPFAQQHIAVNIQRRNQMSDEIKKVEEEAVKAEPSAELSEPALDEVVGGTDASRLSPLYKVPDVTLKRG